MWLSLAFLSAALLGFYDSCKKQALGGNAVIPVLFLNTLFCSLIFIPLIVLSYCTPALDEGTEKGIYFYILENRLFEEFFKFLQVCSNFRFSRGYYQKNGAYCPYFPFLLSSIRFILTRFDANIATALCIVNALRP